MNVKYYHNLKAQGLCVKCVKQPAVENRTRCRECAEIENARLRPYNKEKYYWLKEHHICVRCGQEDAEPNKTSCFECGEIEKARSRLREKSLSPDTKEKRRIKKPYTIRRDITV